MSDQPTDDLEVDPDGHPRPHGDDYDIDHPDNGDDPDFDAEEVDEENVIDGDDDEDDELFETTQDRS